MKGCAEGFLGRMVELNLRIWRLAALEGTSVCKLS